MPGSLGGKQSYGSLEHWNGSRRLILRLPTSSIAISTSRSARSAAPRPRCCAPSRRIDIAEMKCSAITSADIVSFAQALKVAPQTVSNYLSHLAAIFAIARPAWGYPLDQQAMKDAFAVAKKLGLTAKGRQRERRPTIEELDQIMEHFGVVSARRPGSLPMQRIIPFAIFSTRRQEEIVRIRWTDYDGNRVMVRDMKHPGDKLGNDVWCDLPPEASAIVESMPRRDERIFPYSTDAISAAFTRACHVLGIDDLHFHDLRHEGVSRLFEIGWNIPQVAKVSGHRSWSSLKRYEHMRQTGDKFDGWKWAQPAMLSVPRSPAPAMSLVSMTCISTICGTKASRGCSRWAGLSRKLPPCRDIGRGNP